MVNSTTGTTTPPSISNEDFAFDLYKLESSQKGDENVIISPLSVDMALKMLINGSDNVSTSDLQKTLRTTKSVDEINASTRQLIDNLKSSDSKVELGIANSLWARNGFPIEKQFVDDLGTHYDAVAYNKPFDNTTKDEINTWVSDKTKNKIKKILDKFTGDHVMFLINALYFKADWSFQFDKNSTTEEDFTKLDGSNDKVDMMKKTSVRMPYHSTEEYQAVAFPFSNGNYEMVAIMPQDVSKFNVFEQSLSLNSFDEITSNMEAKYLDVSLPKFKVEYKNKLKGTLKSMGMNSLFSESECDLSKMTSVDNILVSEVLHKVYFDCNESGVEAAAVTSIGAVVTSVPPPGNTGCL